MPMVNTKPAKRNKILIGRTRADLVFDCFNNIIMTAILLIVVFPILYIVSCSFSSSVAVASGRVWFWPVEPTLLAYKMVYEYQTIWRGYLNSIIYTVAGATFSTGMTLLAAYPLSRSDFGLRRMYMILFTFTMLFSGGLIPFYLVVLNLGLINTFWAMIIPWGLSVWNIIITRTFFQQTISGEILDAAQIDGCTDFGFFTYIALPVSGAIIAVNVLFYGVGKWNSYFDALIFVRSAERMPLQIILRRILILNSVDKQMTSQINVTGEAELARVRELIKYALIVVSSAPMLCAYPFVQKYFVKGMMIGSVKG